MAARRFFAVLVSSSVWVAACNLIGGIEPAEPECPVDGQWNGRETDVDCGGPCAPCRDFLRCAADADCANHVCEGGSCQPPTCYDSRKNGFETDIDCGGDDEECERCHGAEGCLVDDDCAANVIISDACVDGVCVPLCCFEDCDGCENGCPDTCPAGSLGTSCEVDDCLDPFSCLDELDTFVCL